MDLKMVLRDYFWLFLIGLAIIKMIIVWLRLSRIVITRPELRHDSDVFLRGFLFYFSIPFLLMWVLQRAGGFNTPLFMFSMDVSNVFVFMSWLLILFSWIVLILWTFLQNGAEYLKEIRTVFMVLPGSETGIKVVILVAVGLMMAAVITGIGLDLRNMITF
jgi:hypothetical protein